MAEPNETALSAEREGQLPVQIFKIGQHYLLFDVEDVVHLRKKHNVCAVLVGALPQHPNQTTFNGLPIELGADEVHSLESQGLARVVDESVPHTPSIAGNDGRPHTIPRKMGSSVSCSAEKCSKPSETRLLRRPAHNIRGNLESGRKSPTGNPYTSNTNLPITTESKKPIAEHEPGRDQPRASPSMSLYHYLRSTGYYITPGIRFGAQYSVYPGDPLRFHAHFLANQYGWEEEFPIADLVGTGRLATGVKKGFLIGGKEENGDSDVSCRTFCIEWASM